MTVARSNAAAAWDPPCRTAVARSWAIALAVTGLVSSIGLARAQAPAEFTCGQGLQGQLYELGTDVPNTSPDRIAALTSTLTDSAKDAAFNDWGSGPPTPPFNAATATDHFFDRWYGGFLAPSEGGYTFTITGDDGVRLWLSKSPIDPTKPGTPTLNGWVDQSPTNYTAPAVHLKAGEFLYVLFEHYENGGGAVAKLSLDGGVTGIDPKNLCAGPLPTSLDTGTVSGTVKDDKGNPLAGSVTLSTPGLDSVVALDMMGAYSITLPVGTYTVTAVPSDQAMVVSAGGTASATVTKGAIATANLTVTLQALPSFTLDNTNSKWKFLKEPTVQGKVPTPFDPAIVSDPSFNDAAWMDQDPTMRSNADTDSGVIIPGNYWLRGKFALGATGIPASFAVDQPAVMYNFDVDARSLGIWVNGVPVGAQPTGDDPPTNTYLIPAGTLKKSGDNLIVIRGENGATDMGLSPNLIHIRATQPTLGTVQVRASGADPAIGGVGDGVTVTLVDAGGNTFKAATTSIPGTAFFLDVPPGTYSLTASGPLVDTGTQMTGIDVKAAQTAVVTVPTNPAKGLGNAYLTQGGPWRAIGDIDPTDLKPAQPDFDDSSWQTVTFLPGTLVNTDQALTGFGDMQDAWLRLKFQVPAGWASLKRDLVLDDFNVDDADTTFFNGQQIGSTMGAGMLRSYTVPQSIVKFGGDNVLAILVHNDTGDEGITDRTQPVRLHVAAGTAMGGMTGGMTGGVKGDLNGDGKVDIKDATLSLQIAVGSLTPSAAQTAAGDVNGDGKLNIQDTTLILAAAVGIHPL